MDTEAEYWELRLEQDDAAPQPVPEVVPAPDAIDESVVDLRGEGILVTFFGVQHTDAYLREDALRGGQLRGPKLKAEFKFSDYVSLAGLTCGTMQSFAAHALMDRVSLPATNLAGSVVRSTKTTGTTYSAAVGFEYVDLSTPIRISHEEGVKAKIQLTVFVGAQELHCARVARAAERYEVFRERADAACNKKVPDGQLATLIGHSSSTIKIALGARSPMGGATLGDVEATMRKHFADGFDSFAVALEAALMKKGKRVAQEPPVAEGAGVLGSATKTTKRTRTNISRLGQVFIDSYLDMFMETKANRGGLFASILKAAETRKEELEASAWTDKTIATRLKNEAIKKRKSDRAARVAAGGAEVAEVEEAEEEEEVVE
jgi:hypothetical protein